MALASELFIIIPVREFSKDTCPRYKEPLKEQYHVIFSLLHGFLVFIHNHPRLAKELPTPTGAQRTRERQTHGALIS